MRPSDLNPFCAVVVICRNREQGWRQPPLAPESSVIARGFTVAEMARQWPQDGHHAPRPGSDIHVLDVSVSLHTGAALCTWFDVARSWEAREPPTSAGAEYRKEVRWASI